MNRALILAAASLAVLAGCDTFSATERMITLVGEKIVIPIVQEAQLETLTESFAMQAGAQGVEPGVIVEVEGKLVQGFEGVFRIYGKGLAGQLQTSTQANRNRPTVPAEPVAVPGGP